MKPGWYNDPSDPRHERYFDGGQWTARVRADIPDIPLAPWVNPAHPDYAYGHIVDTTPPTSSVRSWLTALAGLALIGAALGYGVVSTNNFKAATGGAGNYGIDVQVPPAGGGAAVLETLTCQDLQDQFERQFASGYGIEGFSGSPTTLADHQPITSLPSGDTYYLVIRCETYASFTDGAVSFARA